MDQVLFEQLLVFFKTLADENRLKLIGMLAEREYSVEELATRLKVREPTVSHHLARLKELGLVKMRREGNNHYYQLEASSLHRLSKDVLSLEKIAAPEPEQATDLWEQKILKDYLQEGKLTKIPSTRKKREVILRWLVEQLAWEKRYPEKEINAFLLQYHWDSATLRREFIMTGLMQRDQGLYWRI
ncbi:ArsR family transcriptional regulator [bacterium (Candidatus Blackallbacteria) CG17_big_fil_post_rev_8_21_14_2_50_48_46]|uniref:ArsR family transcriptional regulator n=1 Tax=bacterium (Candidatus Blackallbacteria) CG17_big_fil_post_rev_8_21_14_2_50_48_46 TaxID=2014261 RepID=A0A2M7G3G0_9BACT|nr:MAG: ArsR family transcriptional regulator [bacterium (Candidatus Blackallbacteria) CG18_big_fil_WC_8_21_14_2_50_49_26]PIW16366.1 MAG: ArsR family transcriptional regulator [bacterium (Candidatus Blackallbacteria) CG17_big_fil_post_rev_8_21_14_2_50_48_46]PIW45379.1 MAG: ArsR family transcriptional regulator [bacterium (Candidatus Blackallbacteria) CG13_big_fil_rev_8_21_14_2_50_49_14]